MNYREYERRVAAELRALAALPGVRVRRRTVSRRAVLQAAGAGLVGAVFGCSSDSGGSGGPGDVGGADVPDVVDAGPDIVDAGPDIEDTGPRWNCCR